MRFRPIMMTTMAALLGGVPLMLSHGTGSELRQPLGYAMVGGLIVCQALTLFTTPVIYLYLDRLSHWLSGSKQKARKAAAPREASAAGLARRRESAGGVRLWPPAALLPRLRGRSRARARGRGRQGNDLARRHMREMFSRAAGALCKSKGRRARRTPHALPPMSNRGRDSGAT